ncbi:unnamed protein product [Rotaria sp. Silwood1]|nr:unnamed protein product [Rotaria sp. Silwood1]CAF0844345.1 unnamed protein product [Rotaria sp. Silwood1]CAF3364879.1 unnamed protein product [Rotaria sp. Silwood1]CAF3365487.1 unnamed protein product [Rotaria sp. Silwood1]CAF4648556.1 unnamed protein product [Rotaria sp. Silwood1]
MDDNLSSYLATVGVSALNRYGVLFLLIVGTLGNLLNVYVFSRPHLRHNTCVLCLLLSSFLNFLVLIFGVFIRCLIGYNIDLTYNSSIFCKIRHYVIYASQSVSLWLIVLACIDRYLSSSSNIVHHRWINRRKVFSIVSCISILTSLSYIEVFFCFEASLITNNICSAKNQLCSYIDTANFLIFNSFLPPSLMLSFGAAMLINIKQSYQRVEDIQSNTRSIHRINRRDRQLISILLLEVALIVVSMFPITIVKFYQATTSVIRKSQQQMNNEYFVSQVSIVVSYINSSGMFFIYTIRGTIFRIELIRLFDRLLCCHQQNQLRQRILHMICIHPIERF